MFSTPSTQPNKCSVFGKHLVKTKFKKANVNLKTDTGPTFNEVCRCSRTRGLVLEKGGDQGLSSTQIQSNQRLCC